MIRFLAMFNHGDGPSYKVYPSLPEAIEYASQAFELGEVFELEGELLSIELGSQGELLVNGEEPEPVWSTDRNEDDDQLDDPDDN